MTEFQRAVWKLAILKIEVRINRATVNQVVAAVSGSHFVEINTPDAGPRGSKGLAEAPNVATAAAISNALAQIVGAPIRRLPMTAERVWEALHTTEGGN